ncbi:MAG: hypothetical protein HZA94_01705 [Candidatus Vogelbacteria bacterium]|nr:hypothetical protein [Candidatus Vogelbacteria bacterium]
MDIYKQLETLGISEKQGMAYLALLRLQKANAHQIAKEAGIERTTTYKILEDLTAKQLITQTRSGKRVTYLADSPTQFQHLLIRQSEVLKDLIPLLSSLQGKVASKPTIKYYEGRDAILKVYKETLKCKEKLFRNFASVPNVEHLLGDRFINAYTEARIKKGIVTRSLRATPKDKAKIENWYLKDENATVLRETRYLDTNLSVDAFIKTYDDFILLISFGREPSMVVVESPELAQTMKVLFDIAWNQAKSVL